jgi:hypothetical protein
LLELAGLAPKDIEAMMAAEPASVQERWFARLFLLKPVVFGVFSVVWIATGLVALGPGWKIGMSLMREGGAGGLPPNHALRLVCRACHFI